MKYATIDAITSTSNQLDALSQLEIEKILQIKQSTLYALFRNCSLAVLNCGSDLDNNKELLERYKSFEIKIIQENYKIKFDLKGAPATAFIDGKIIEGVKEHLFSVLRDILYLSIEMESNPHFNLTTTEGITNSIFHILHHAHFLNSDEGLVVCWGGHAIAREEYDYTFDVGEQLGLRGLDICTGCGNGAMKGPMEGAAVGHNKQRIKKGRYLGITEPRIIAVESPNPIVNTLVIMPDIEKRLEAFIRMAHGVVIFPGGVGTMEEILYLLGVLLHPDNEKIPFPLIFTGPAKAKEYFQKIDSFLGQILGEKIQKRYKIIIDDPSQVAREIQEGVERLREFRKRSNDSSNFSWLLKIDSEFQKPFIPTHDAMAGLNLYRDQEPHVLIANLRRVFSGIISGNIQEQCILCIEEKGHFQIRGDVELMHVMDDLLRSFAEQKRMNLHQKEYVPCYQICK